MNPRLLETSHLLDAVRAGDPDAVTLLYDRYIERIKSWTRGRVPFNARGLHDTDTISHDVLVRSLMRVMADDAALRGPFQAYVRRALRNQLIDLATRGARAMESIDERLPSDSPGALERVLEQELVDEFRSRIAALPRDARQLLHLRFELGASHAKIAEHLGLASEGAARMRVQRVVLQLREQLVHTH